MRIPSPRLDRARLPRRASRSLPTLALSALVAAAIASPVAAEELRLGVEGNYTFNSNFFSAGDNEEEANSFQFGPSVNLSEREGRFHDPTPESEVTDRSVTDSRSEATDTDVNARRFPAGAPGRACPAG